MSAVKLGWKVFDDRVIRGGEVKTLHPGQHTRVVAIDLSSAYPAARESSNIDTSARVPQIIIDHPEQFGIKCLKTITVDDMYNSRRIKFFEKNGKEFIVEEFKCEYKIKKKDVEEAIRTYFNSSNYEDKDKAKAFITKEYPECLNELNRNNSNITVEETVFKELWFVQSPKDPITDLATTHYSLKEAMLTDLRAKRSSVKKLMAKAEDEGNELERIRYNSKQLAIKVTCNADYGASGSKFFPYYDQIVAGTVTWSSRTLIHFISTVLESNEIFVDKKFIEKNKEWFDFLTKYNVLQIDSKWNNNEIPMRRRALRRMFNKFYEYSPNENYVKLIAKPCTVIYQDTDSNYYINKFVQESFSELNPDSIDISMRLMATHNLFYSEFIRECVARRPVAVGFEAAKIVSRYFNVKKKYYGIEWNFHMKPVLPDKNAYENGILKKHYNMYWKPNVSTLPREDGSYIELNSDKLLNDRVDYVEYVHQQNVSVTGMSIARRDYYKFVNYSNLEVYKNDMRLIQYEGDGKWVNVQSKTVENAVNKVLDGFRDQIRRIEEIIYNMDNNIEDQEYFRLPEPLFHLQDYSKNVAYKGEKNQNSTAFGIISKLVEYKLDKMETADKNKLEYELLQENNGEELSEEKKIHRMAIKLDLIKVFERVPYVIVLTPEVKEAQRLGKANTGKTSDQVMPVKLFEEKIKDEYPIDKYESKLYHDSISYDQFIELVMISKLDFKHYMESLCSSLALYAVEYLCEDEIKRSNDARNTEKERMEIVKKAQDTATGLLLAKYFKTGKKIHQSLKNIKDNIKKYKKPMELKRFDKQGKLHEVLLHHDLLEKDNYERMQILNHNIERICSEIKFMEEVIQISNTNSFNYSDNLTESAKKLLEFLNNPEQEQKLYDIIEQKYKTLTDLEYVRDNLK